MSALIWIKQLLQKFSDMEICIKDVKWKLNAILFMDDIFLCGELKGFAKIGK